MWQRRLAVASEQADHGAHGQRRTEVHIPREYARPPLEQLAPVLAPVHPPAVQVKYQGHPPENHKDTAIASCIFVFCQYLSTAIVQPCPYHVLRKSASDVGIQTMAERRK